MARPLEGQARRDSFLTIRLSPAEHDTVIEEAKRAKKPVARFARDRVMGLCDSKRTDLQKSS